MLSDFDCGDDSDEDVILFIKFHLIFFQKSVLFSAPNTQGEIHAFYMRKVKQ